MTLDYHIIRWARCLAGRAWDGVSVLIAWEVANNSSNRLAFVNRIPCRIAVCRPVTRRAAVRVRIVGRFERAYVHPVHSAIHGDGPDYVQNAVDSASLLYHIFYRAQCIVPYGVAIV